MTPQEEFFINALDDVDACVQGGDLLSDKEQRQLLEKYIASRNKQIESWKKIEEAQ